MWFPEGLEDTPFKLKVLNYSRNCSLHAALIPNLVKPLVYIPNTKNSIKLHLLSPQLDQGLAFSNRQLAMGWSSVQVYTIQNYYYKFDYAEQSEGKLRSPSALAHSKMEHHCWVANSNSALSPSLHSKVLQPTVKPNDAHTHALLVGYTKRWTPEDLIGIDKKSPTKTFQA